jgi:hypothetical protein
MVAGLFFAPPPDFQFVLVLGQNHAEHARAKEVGPAIGCQKWSRVSRRAHLPMPRVTYSGDAECVCHRAQPRPRRGSGDRASFAS